MEPFSAKLSQKKTKALFYNADSSETAAIFAGLEHVTVKGPSEVRDEAEPIDPFASINERNVEMTKARTIAAEISDDRQILVKGPTKKGETVAVAYEELTPLVRQAAEAALLRRPKLLRKIQTGVKK
jgi:hypothetical protein